MRLLHYSEKPVTSLLPVALPLKPDAKPRGLWVSVEGEDDWFSWYQGEGLGLGRLSVVHEVVLKPEANILYVTSVDAILGLSQDFGRSPEWAKDFAYVHELDWAELAKMYQGIVIAPYQWECRLDYRCHWYYGWDCASGCIWDIDAVESTTVLENLKV